MTRPVVEEELKYVSEGEELPRWSGPTYKPSFSKWTDPREKDMVTGGTDMNRKGEGDRRVGQLVT